jgi:peptide/nickel transport system permease protein
MTKFIIRRLFLGALTVLAITFVMFVFQQLLPDKPYALLINRPNQSLAQINEIKARFGADTPFLNQYGVFLRNIFKPFWSWWGWPPHAPSAPDLGESVILHTTVYEEISLRLPATAQLMITAYIFTLLVAIPIGIISAVKQYSRLDNTVTSLSFIGISIPNYWFGTMLIYAFAVFPYEHGLGNIFPATGQHSNGVDSGLADLAWHLVLPVIVLAVQSIAGYARFIRSAMLEVLSQDYIRTARAKGLAGRRVVIRHAFRNSLLPFITLMGLDIPTLFVGAIITEVVFNWPGMGRLFVTSASANDFPILIGIALILSVLVVVGNLIADVAYTWADPRISYEKR